MLVKLRNDGMDGKARRRKRRTALLGGIVLSLFVSESVLAQNIVIDPSMLQSGLGSGNGSSDEATANNGSSDSNASGATAMSKVPAFQTGSIADAPKPDEPALASNERTACCPRPDPASSSVMCARRWAIRSSASGRICCCR
jgi:hypothetical protein